MLPEFGHCRIYPTTDGGAVEGKVVCHLGGNRYTVETSQGLIDVSLDDPYRY